MVCPSTTAQQSAGGVNPDTVTDMAPVPVLVVVVPPARSTAVTVSVEVKVSAAWTRRPVSVQEKLTLVTPHAIGGDELVVDGPGLREVVLEVDERGSVVLGPPDGPPPVGEVRPPVEPGTEGEVGTAAEVAIEVATGSVAEAVPTPEPLPGGRTPDPNAPNDDAAWAWTGERSPPSTDHAPHPARRRTIVKIPAAPIIDIERMPTAPPAPGGRWRPAPCSIVIADQDKPPGAAEPRPPGFFRNARRVGRSVQPDARVGPVGLEPTTYGLKVRSSAIELETRRGQHNTGPQHQPA